MKKKKMNIKSATVVRIVFSVLATGSIIALLIASSFANMPNALDDEVVTPITATVNTDYPEGMAEVARNSRFVLYADVLNGCIRLGDTLTGGSWDSSPDGVQNNEDIKGAARMSLGSLLDIKYADRDSNTSKQNSIVGCVNRNTIGADKIDGGIRFDFHFSKEGFFISLELTLTDKGLTARVPLDLIKEESSAIKLISIAPLPNFGAGCAIKGAENDGYVLAPDGCGAIIPFGIDTGIDYSQRVYGNDGAVVSKTNSTKTQNALLPVFGIERDGLAMTAIITEGDSRAAIKSVSATARSPYTTVYTEFIYRETTLVDISQKTFESTQVNMFEPGHCMLDSYTVEYRPGAGTDGYVGMAQTYRDYLTGDLNVTAKPGNAPLYVDLLGGVMRQQSILGVPVEAVSPITTFNDAAELAERLKTAGVDRLSFKYIAWTKNGTQNVLPTALSPDGSLGGKSGLKKMISKLSDLDVALNLDVNLTDMWSGQWGYHLRGSAAQSVQREPAAQYSYKMSTFQIDSDADVLYLLSPYKLAGLASKVAGWSSGLTTGISAGTLGQKIYSDFSKTPIDRGAALAEWEKAMTSLAGDDGVMFSAANAYAIPYSSALLDIPTSYSAYLAEERSVPFYQIALHGLRSMSVTSVNNADSIRDALLYAVETGTSLKFTMGTRNIETLSGTAYSDLSYINADDWMDKACEMYAEISDYLKAVANQTIVSHELLADGVTRTGFEGGTLVIVNYNDSEVQINGEIIAEKGYLFK